MARAYRMTPKRRAALRKAQLASARARRKGYRSDVRKARSRAKGYVRQRGGAPSAKVTAIRRYDQDVNIARVKHLGKKSRSLKSQRNRRLAKDISKSVAVAGVGYALTHPGTQRRLHKGARRVAASPHYAKGFKRGFQQSRARNQAAARHMRNAQRHGTTVRRVPLTALPPGTGAKSYSGKRVRGY